MTRRSIYLFWLLTVVFFVALWGAHGYLKQLGVAVLPGDGGEFTLTSDTGERSLSDYRGQVVVLYFGYMSCPDVCPTSLYLLAQAFPLLSKEQQQQVQVIFISLDPDRDTPQAMSQYVQAFHPSFEGLTGSNQQVAEVARQYAVNYRKSELENSVVGYVVDHSSVTYVIDQQGILQFQLEHNTQPRQIAETVIELLQR